MAQVDEAAARNAAVLRARMLRRTQSLPEGILWQTLRTRPGELKFRRQHPFERCTVDFYCASASLVVEVDGDGHSMGGNPERDAARDRWLARKGLKVLRFDASDVLRDVESVVRAIVLAARR